MSEWVEVGTVSDFEFTDRKYIEVNEDVQIGLFKLEDEKFYAVEAWCSHQKVSLVTGNVDGYEIMCPLHGARFDLRNGQHLCQPAVRPLESYPVKINGESIQIKVD